MKNAGPVSKILRKSKSIINISFKRAPFPCPAEVQSEDKVSAPSNPQDIFVVLPHQKLRKL